MHVLIITPCSSGLAYITAAKERDMRVSVITVGHKEFVIPDGFKRHIDRLEIAGENNQNDFVQLAKTIHADSAIDGVVAGEECYVPMAAYVAAALGLPGIDPVRVEAVRNKAIMRQCLVENNIRVPRFARATNAVDVEQVVQQVGFPVVIKPVNMAASIGVARADDTVQLLAAYEDILHESKGLSGFLPSAEVLIEELLVGTEYCVDGYVTQDGTVTVCELIKIELGPQPHFQEIGYTSYQVNDVPFAQELIAYVTSVVKAVGVTIGAFHSEIMLTKDGPVLIEIAARLPGDHCPILTETATGVSFSACALAAYMGLPIPEPGIPVARVAASQYIIAPDLAGQTYSRLEGWGELKGLPEVDSALIEIPAGTMIPLEEDARARIAEIRYHAGSIEEAEAFRKHILETVRVIR